MLSFKQFIKEAPSNINPANVPTKRAKEKHEKEKAELEIRQGREAATAREDEFKLKQVEKDQQRKQKEIEKQRVKSR